MYSLTINFGPTGTVWAFLFKEEEAARRARAVTNYRPEGATHFTIVDDFGQTSDFPFNDVHGVVLEDLDQVEAARIYRSLAEERIKVKLMTAAKADPVIGEAIRRSQGAPVLTPMGGFRQ